MKALILSSNTGAGHNACANAVQEAMMARDIPCDIRDGLSFLSKKASRFVAEWHSRLYRTMPRLYGEGYGLAERRAQDFDDDSLAFRFLSLGAKPLGAYVASHGYTDVICTHLFPAMMLTQLQNTSPLPIVTSFISTDYTASPGYDAIRLDQCFIPAQELTPEFVTPNMPASRIVPCGMPVCRAFTAAGDRDAAKHALGLDPALRHLLVMSGSMGCGPVKRIVNRLAESGGVPFEISVICGTNRKLSRQLSNRHGERGNVHIHDFVDRVALFMDSADLYLTKPGGLSVSEAMAKRLPMALIRAVDGCETHNLRYCLDRGVAVTADDPTALADLCARLIHDDAALNAMRDANGPRSGTNAADTLVACLLERERST